MGGRPTPDPLAHLRPQVPGTWRVAAVAYGTRMGLRGEHFLGHDGRAQEPHPTAYYVWLAISDATIDDTILDETFLEDLSDAVTGDD